MKTLYLVLAALILGALSFLWVIPMTQDRNEPLDEPAVVEGAISTETYHKANWKLHVGGSWEWFDEGKELIFEFGANSRFDYFEKAHQDKLIDSEDRGSGEWLIIRADEYTADVRLVFHNSDDAELIFYLASLDEDNMAVRTADMEDDTYLLFTRYSPPDSD